MSVQRRFKILLLIGLLALLGGTSPDNLSAPALMAAVLFIGLATWLLLRGVIFATLRRFNPAATTDMQQDSLPRILVVASLILVFLFALNLTGTLSLRDIILAALMGFTFNFYIERRLNNSQ